MEWSPDGMAVYLSVEGMAICLNVEGMAVVVLQVHLFIRLLFLQINCVFLGLALTAMFKTKSMETKSAMDKAK
jgi:hypothetical protein